MANEHNLIDGSTNRIDFNLGTGIKVKACPGGSVQITDDKGNGIQIASGGAVTVIGGGSFPSAPVTSVFGRTGAVAAQTGDYAVANVTGAAPLASPTLTGSPKAPTQAPGSNDTGIATDAYTDAAVLVETTRATTAEALLAPKASPALTGIPTVPTASVNTNSTQAASSAYVDQPQTGPTGTAGITFPTMETWPAVVNLANNPGVPTANIINVVPFFLHTPLSLKNASIQVGTLSAGGTVFVAIYSADGNTLLAQCSFSITSTGIKTSVWSVNPLILKRGPYLMAYTTVETVQNVARIAGPGTTGFNPNAFTGGVLNATVVKCGTAANPVSGGIFPATLGVITAANIEPIYVYSEP